MRVFASSLRFRDLGRPVLHRIDMDEVPHSSPRGLTIKSVDRTQGFRSFPILVRASGIASRASLIFGCFLVASPIGPRQATVAFSTTHKDGAAERPQQMRSFWRTATGISKHNHLRLSPKPDVEAQIPPPLPLPTRVFVQRSGS